MLFFHPRFCHKCHNLATFLSEHLPQCHLIQNDKLWNESGENLIEYTTANAYQGIIKRVGKVQIADKTNAQPEQHPLILLTNQLQKDHVGKIRSDRNPLGNLNPNPSSMP